MHWICRRWENFSAAGKPLPVLFSPLHITTVLPRGAPETESGDKTWTSALCLKALPRTKPDGALSCPMYCNRCCLGTLDTTSSCPCVTHRFSESLSSWCCRLATLRHTQRMAGLEQGRLGSKAGATHTGGFLLPCFGLCISCLHALGSGSSQHPCWWGIAQRQETLFALLTKPPN